MSTSRQSTAEGLSTAIVCALLPGPCVARAVHDAGAAAGAEARRQAAAAGQLAAATAGAAGGSAAHVFDGFGDGVRDIVREAAAPVEETASAFRFGSVALAVITVALVILGLVLAVKVL